MTTDENVSTLIGEIYDTTLDPGLWNSVLERLSLFVGAAAAAIYWQDVVDQTATLFHNHGTDPHYIRTYLDTYVDLNPIYPAAVFLEPGLVYSGEDFAPHEEFRQTRFYKEWVAPQDLADLIGVNLQRYPTSCACFSVHLGNEHGVADDEARWRFGLIAPHVRRAVLIGRHIVRSDGRANEFETILNAHRAAVFLVADGGRLTFVNEAGRALLDEGHVVIERNGSLTSGNAQAARLLLAAASGILPASEDRKTVSIALTDTAPRWLADVLPLLSGSRLAVGLDYGSSAAIFVRRAEMPVASGIEIMAELYALRASEVRVLQALSQRRQRGRDRRCPRHFERDGQHTSESAFCQDRHQPAGRPCARSSGAWRRSDVSRLKKAIRAKDGSGTSLGEDRPSRPFVAGYRIVQAITLSDEAAASGDVSSSSSP